MSKGLHIQGRDVTAADLENIRGLIATHPEWSRCRLSQVLATEWDWRNGAGRLKDMAARSLLAKLEERGLICLPPRRRLPPNRMASSRPRPWQGDQDPIECSLNELRPLTIEEVSRSRDGRELFASALASFHYLGYRGAVGENLQYLVRDRKGRPLACLLFGAPAWKCQDRDRFIGWNAEERKSNLFRIAGNSRFLILPWVDVRHLGSFSLARVLRGLSRDWLQKYGHRIDWVETFVERDRFRGTVYKAAGWRHVGSTTGRTRQDRYTTIQEPVKEVYLYPLSRSSRKGVGR